MSKQDPTIILGIDPGTAVTGYGLIKLTPSGHEVVDFGCIRPPSSMKGYERYLIIYNALNELIAEYQPTAIAVESQFVYKNPQSALTLGIAKGMAILAALVHKIPIAEYAPKKAKMAVTGSGNSTKEQVQRMIQLLLKLPKLPTPADAADALALAICHAHALQGRIPCSNTSKEF